MRSRIILSIILVIFFRFIGVSQEFYLNMHVEPAFGDIELTKGFDAPFIEREVSVNPGVSVQNLNFCMDCKGFLGKEAVLELKWSGETDQLRVHFEPEKFGTDACLAVYTPTKQWLYADNFEMGQEGPFVYLYGYDSGTYRIYVGGGTETDTIRGRIIITESYIPDESVRESDVGLDVGFVPTPRSKVDSMLDVAHILPGDYLIDLGCGDGRIVIEAGKRGAFAHGIDLDPLRIEESWENAKIADVLDKVSFEEGNIFDADLSQATVITTYLLDKINEQLIPKFLKELRPGTRIVSYSFRMGDWEPDITFGEDCQKVYLWTVPAQMEGQWWFTMADKEYKMTVEQKYQKIKMTLTENGQKLSVEETVLNGTRIGFTVTHPQKGHKFTFNGSVEGSTISGQVRIQNDEGHSMSLWNAHRK